VEERLASERYAKGKWFETCRGTREKKRKREKNAQGAWIIWRRKRENNGARGRRESARRQRAKARDKILFYSYSK